MATRLFLASLILATLSQCRCNHTAPVDQANIQVGWDSMPLSYDPRYSTDANSQYLDSLLHCSLIDFDDHSEPVGKLAEEWHWQSPTTLEMTIASNYKFADGTPVTVFDVKATFDFFLTKQTPTSPKAQAFRFVRNITADEAKQTVTFHLTDQDANLVNNLIIGVLPPSHHQNLISNTNPVPGCGPFQLAKKDLGRLTLIPNPHFPFRAPPPKQVVIKEVKEESTAFAKLLSGELDIVQNQIAAEKLDRIKSGDYPKLALSRQAALKTSYIGFNFLDPHLKQPAVRRAIAMAIDRDAIIKHILKGYAQKSLSLLPPDHSDFNRNLVEIAFDPKAANELLDRAGFPIDPKTGFRFKLTYSTTNNVKRLTIGRTIASHLDRIGIQLDVRSLEWGKFKDEVNKGSLQLWGLAWIGFKGPDIYNYAFASQNQPPAGANRGRYSNAKLDQLLAEADRTVEPTKRRELYNQIQEIVSQDLPYVFLWHEENVAVVSKTIQNFKVYPDGQYRSLTSAVKL